MNKHAAYLLLFLSTIATASCATSKEFSTESNDNKSLINTKFKITYYDTPISDTCDDNFYCGDTGVHIQGSGYCKGEPVQIYWGTGRGPIRTSCRDFNYVEKILTSKGTEPTPGFTLASDRKYLGKCFHIPDLSHYSQNGGYFLAEDTGGGVTGNHFDLYAGKREEKKPAVKSLKKT